jgi:tRNA(Ile)-lysidine synthase
MLLQKVQEYITSNRLFTVEDKLLVGVSGGMDSVVLLYILKELGYTCIAAHCNFHLRGEESNRDERFVTSLAEKWHIPFFKTDFDTEQYASEKGISIEMAARDLRYSWFKRIKEEERADYIAIAHHSDDVTETFFINLTRGTGIHGLTGIRPKKEDIVRPLLALSRNEISDFVRKEKLSFVEDSTNKENIYIRNRFRNRIIPQFKTINPSFQHTILQTIHHLRETEQFLKEQIAAIKKNIIRTENDLIFISIEKLEKQASASYILFEILQPYGFSATVIADIWNGINAHSGKQYFAEKYRIIKDRNNLILSVKEKETTPAFFQITETDQQINQPLTITISYRTMDSDFVIEKNKNSCYLDADKLTFPLTIRKWEKGDYFIPFGMKNRKKVSDYFIDRHFSLIEKENCWLLTSGEEIAWIIGERSDERFKITEKTKKIIILKVNE